MGYDWMLTRFVRLFVLEMFDGPKGGAGERMRHIWKRNYKKWIKEPFFVVKHASVTHIYSYTAISSFGLDFDPGRNVCLDKRKEFLISSKKERCTRCAFFLHFVLAINWENCYCALHQTSSMPVIQM